jgi:uncharacterized protein
MKEVIIIHGWGGSPNEPLHQYLKGLFEKEGFNVKIPNMPHPETPTIEDWVSTIKENVNNLENTIFVGHSVGCQAVLRFVERLNLIVPRIILIAPWMELDEQTIEDEGEEVKEIARPWMETPIDFEKIKSNIKSGIAIFSDNDLYVPLSQKDFFENKLNIKTLVEHNQGHFDPSSGFTELQTDFYTMLEK